MSNRMPTTICNNCGAPIYLSSYLRADDGHIRTIWRHMPNGDFYCVDEGGAYAEAPDDIAMDDYVEFARSARKGLWKIND